MSIVLSRCTSNLDQIKQSILLVTKSINFSKAFQIFFKAALYATMLTRPTAIIFSLTHWSVKIVCDFYPAFTRCVQHRINYINICAVKYK